MMTSVRRRRFRRRQAHLANRHHVEEYVDDTPVEPPVSAPPRSTRGTRLQVAERFRPEQRTAPRFKAQRGDFLDAGSRATPDP